MLLTQLARIAGVALLLAATPLSPASSSEKKTAAAVEAGNLLIDTAWTRATPGGAKVGAGYLTIVNRGEDADRLVSGKSDIASRVEIHTMTMTDGVMRMRELKDGLVLAPKSITELKPGGFHIMFMDLKKPITEGDEVKLELSFEKAGAVQLSLRAAGIGAKSPPGKPVGAGAAAGSRSGSEAAGSRSK